MKNRKNEFTENERKELLKIARDTIVSYLEQGEKPGVEKTVKKFNERRGVFVTLHKKGQLRGCIGYPLPVMPLIDAVADNAVSAAFRDPRFPPVNKNELKEIDIEISILTVPAKKENIKDIKVGRDGIIVSKGANRGLLLPQVPVEQGWDLEEFLSYGCMKAGLPGGAWRTGVQIETFQAEVFGELNHENS